MKDTTLVRLDKFLANSGVGARRDMKRLIKSHHVTVNGTQVKELGYRIRLGQDTVAIDGAVVEKKGFVYYALNKPLGIISTTTDNYGRESVVDLIDTTEEIYPIGRLDKDTHGLILLTNDGALTHKLIHPKYHVNKTYRLQLEETPNDAQLRAFREGVLLRDGITLPATVTICDAQNKSVIEMTIREGKNRQIRRMCEVVGLTLIDLQRIAFGPIHLESLAPGASRLLSPEEVTALKDATKR